MKADRVRELLLLPVSILILVAWSVSLVDAVLYNQFTPLTLTMPLMLIFGGFLFGSSIVRRALRSDE